MPLENCLTTTCSGPGSGQLDALHGERGVFLGQKHDAGGGWHDAVPSSDGRRCDANQAESNRPFDRGL